MKILKVFLFLAITSLFQISSAQEVGSIHGALTNIAGNMVNSTYLQLYGSVGGSTASKYFSGGMGPAMCVAGQSSQKTCQLGANGPSCSQSAPSVISGETECWNQGNFLLYTNSGAQAQLTPYSVVARLQGTKTDEPYYVAKPAFQEAPVVVDANGKVLADGNVLGCGKFVATSSQTLTCFTPDGKQNNMNIDDLKNLKKGSVYVKDIAQNIGVDLCGVTLGQGKSDGYFSNYRQFNLQSQTSVTVNKIKGTVGATCKMPPHNQDCTHIILKATGMQCYYLGSLVYTVPLKMSPSDMTAVAKKYVFDNHEIVTMAQVSNLLPSDGDINPQIEVTNPQGFVSTPRISSASGGGATSNGGM